MRLHTGGRTRAWLGRTLGGDEALGDRLWRRCLHLVGGLVLVFYLLPRSTFVLLPTDELLLVALGAVLVLEALRRHARVELPTIRPHEAGRVASYAYFAVGLSVAVLVFPRPIAVVAVLGAATVDPLLGELRALGWSTARSRLAGGAAYVALAGTVLALLGPFPPEEAVALALVVGALVPLLEGPASLVPVDDDLLMPVVPGLVLSAVYWAHGGAVVVPGF